MPQIKDAKPGDVVEILVFGVHPSGRFYALVAGRWLNCFTGLPHTLHPDLYYKESIVPMLSPRTAFAVLAALGAAPFHGYAARIREQEARPPHAKRPGRKQKRVKKKNRR